MKKILLFLPCVFLFYNMNAQMLYNENFDNCYLGNVGTDPTGTTHGQGFLFTRSVETQRNDFFKIQNDYPPGNKVLVMTCPPSAGGSESLVVVKRDLATLMDRRTSGNDVIKFEIDFYHGHANFEQNAFTIGLGTGLHFDNNPERLAGFAFFNRQFGFWEHTSGNTGRFDYVADSIVVPYGEWVKLIAYIDYPNHKVYYEIPQLNIAVGYDLLGNKQDKTLDNNRPNVVGLASEVIFKGPNDRPSDLYNKYDKIRVSALSGVPPHVIALSVNNVLSSNFSVYPNPAKDVVTINSDEHYLINQVVIYDTAGKKLTTQIFDRSSTIQLDVNQLASGVYLLHIESNEGLAVKKLIKN